MEYKKIDELPIEIIDGDRGKNYPNGDDFKKEKYCLFLNAKNVTINGFNFSETMFIDKEKDTVLRRGKLKRNDIVLTTRGTVGNVAYYSSDICYENVRINSGMIILRCDENSILPEYLYYVLKTNYLQKQINNIKSGSAQPQLPISTLKNLKIKFINLSLQKKVVKILNGLDKKIELNNKINDNLLDIIKKIYKEWFINYNYPNKSTTFKNTDLGEIPDDWTIKNLEDVFFFQEGPGIRNWQYVEENGTKFINIRCIKDDDLYLDTSNMISNEEAVGKYKHFMLDEWDVVVSTSGTLGKNQIIRKEHLPLCLNTSIIRFKPLKGFEHFAYMYNYLISKEFLDLLNTMACGSVQKNFGPTHLKQIKLKYPSEDVINEFSKVIQPMLNKIQKNKSEIMVLKQLRDTLLPKLMNGEIDLDKIEI